MSPFWSNHKVIDKVSRNTLYIENVEMRAMAIKRILLQNWNKIDEQMKKAMHNMGVSKKLTNEVEIFVKKAKNEEQIDLALLNQYVFTDQLLLET